MGEVREASKCLLREVEPHPHVGDRVVERVEPGEVRAQPDCETAVEPHTRIVVRLLTGAELALQLVELATHVDQRLNDERSLRADTGNGHIRPHMSINMSSMSLMVESTRALAA